MNSLQTSHRGRKMSPLDLVCPPVTSEFLQRQPPGLFYRCQQPLQIPLNHKEVCNSVQITQIFHWYYRTYKKSRPSRIHQFSFYRKILWEKKLWKLRMMSMIYIKSWTPQPPPIYRHQWNYQGLSRLFHRRRKKNNAFTLEFVHINNDGSERVPAECTLARAPTTSNNALVYFTI